MDDDRKLTNIERNLQGKTQEELKEYTTRGGIASGEARRAKKSLAAKIDKMISDKDVQGLMKESLFGSLNKAEIKQVRKFVPADIPDDQVTPLVAMVYSAIHKTIDSGDAASLERLLRVSGETAEIKLKVGNDGGQPFALLDLGAMTDSDLQRVMNREKPDEIVLDGSQYVVVD